MARDILAQCVKYGGWIEPTENGNTVKLCTFKFRRSDDSVTIIHVNAYGECYYEPTYVHPMSGYPAYEGGGHIEIQLKDVSGRLFNLVYSDDEKSVEKLDQAIKEYLEDDSAVLVNAETFFY